MPTITTPQRRNYQHTYGTRFQNGAVSESETKVVKSWNDTKTVTSLHSGNWKWRIKNHYEAGNPLEGERLTQDYGYVDAEYAWGFAAGPWNYTYWRGQGLAYSEAPSSAMLSNADGETLKSQASIKLILKAREAQTQLQSLVSAGEIGQTLRMLRNPAKALFQSIGDYINTARRRARKVARKRRDRVIQGTWLEAQFGWAPLISDIEGAYNALHKLPMSKYKRVRTESQMDGPTTVTTGNTIQGNIVFAYEQRTKVSGSTRAYGEVKVDVNRPGGSLARFGLRASEFLPTVWELIPYSFVADYFTNIGDVIAASQFPLSNFSWTGMTTRKQVTRTRNYRYSDTGTKNNQGSNYRGGSGNGSPSISSLVRVSRQTAIQGAYGLSDLRFEIPGLSKKWLNLAALATVHRNAVRDLR